jgi:hypothetical protein
MPVVLDAPSESADEPIRAFAEESLEESAAAPSSQAGTATATEPRPSSEGARSEPETKDGGTTPVTRRGRAKESFRARRIEGLLQVAGLAALVLVAVGIMTLRADRSGGSSGEDGTGLPLHRKGTASRSAQPAPPALPPQTAPTAPPSSLPATAPPGTAPADSGAPLPPGGSTPAYPVPPPSYPAPPSRPRPPFHHPTSPAEPTPTPSDSPTGKGSKSPIPHPSDS